MKRKHSELVDDLLVKDERMSVHVKDTGVVGSLEVVLDKADHATGPFVPSITVTRPLTSVHLDNSGGKSLTPVPNQSLHHLVASMMIMVVMRIVTGFK